MTAEPIDDLVAERRTLLARLAEIDELLAARGVRTLAPVNGRQRTITLEVLAAIAEGPKTAGEIAARTGQKPTSVHAMLWKLTRKGEIARLDRGVYALPTSEKGSAA